MTRNDKTTKILNAGLDVNQTDSRTVAVQKAQAASKKCSLYHLGIDAACLVAALGLMIFQAGFVFAQDVPDFRVRPADRARDLPSVLTASEHEYFLKKLKRLTERPRTVVRPQKWLVKVRLDSGGVVQLPANLSQHVKPTEGPELSYFIDIETPALLALSHAFERYDKQGLLDLASDDNDADVVLYIDFADRKASSGGKRFRPDKPYNERPKGTQQSAKLRSSVVMLPWTTIIQYETDESSSEPRTLVGADIFIDYPARTFLQDYIARLYMAIDKHVGNGFRGIDDEPKAKTAAELDAKFQKLISQFRAPYLLDMDSLWVSLETNKPSFPVKPIEPNTLVDAIEGAREYHWRPVERFTMPGGIHNSTPCYTGEYTGVLAARVDRAIAFVLGYDVAVTQPREDELTASTTEPVSDQLLANKSLLPYSAALNEFTEDRLAQILLHVLGDKPTTWRDDYNWTLVDFLLKVTGGSLLDAEHAAARALVKHPVCVP